MGDDSKSSGKQFWDRVQTILDKKHISQSTLARKTGFSSQSLSVAKRDGSMPSFERGMRIAEVLKVSPEYLYCGKSYYDEDLEDAFMEIQGNDLASRLVIEIAGFNFEKRRQLLGYISYMKDLESGVDFLSREDFTNGT